VTIAAVYVTAEGVVLGADSTLSVVTSAAGQPAYHYFNHNQKLLEIGDKSTLGILTWGLGSLGGESYRTLVAKLGDTLAKNPAKSVAEVAGLWVKDFYPRYTKTIATSAEWMALHVKKPFDANGPRAADTRTKDEEDSYQHLRATFSVGFCVAGYCLPDREPKAFLVMFTPGATTAPSPVEAKIGFWGAPNMIERLIYGRDAQLLDDLMTSGKWSGNRNDLEAILNKYVLSHGPLPIRDAIDFVHTCIHSTIKAMKFSNFPQICGGPIELAVITTDRTFRWVRHKSWDTAVLEGE
jgi:hypothetical protein